MRNFAKLQKSAKWQKNAILIEMQLNRLVMHFNKALEIMRGTKAGQRDEVSDITDFKGFFIWDERDTTASAGSGTQPPHPPLGGVGFVPPEPSRFLFTFGAYAVPDATKHYRRGLSAKSQNFAKAMQEVTGSAFRDADGRERPSLKIFPRLK
ncbi:hypothetical protein LNU76_005001 [Salmonella enterica]|nr:hypothetical protein [Salmonella enterica]